MSTKREFGKYLFNGSAALLLALSMMPLTFAAEQLEPFSGGATLCAISPNVAFPSYEQKGNNGVLVNYNMSFIYLIRDDESESLMNGWEVQSNNEKQTKGGITFYWGSAEFIPDGITGTGALVEDFKYKATEITSGISGTFTGTGVLEGVTVDYALTPPYPSLVIDHLECFEYAALCGDCLPAVFPGADGEYETEDDEFLQYDISGWIEGYEP